MTKFLIQAIYFFVVAILAYPLLVFLWGQFTPQPLQKNLEPRIPGFMHTRLKEAGSVSKVDILFIGSSHAYRGFDPRVFAKAGYTSFNLGSSSQSPVQSLSLLCNYLPKIQPKLVVLEVYPEVFGLDGLESALDILMNSPVDQEAISTAYYFNHIKYYNALFSKGFMQLFNVDKYTEQPSNQYDQYINGGFVEHVTPGSVPNGISTREWKLLPEQLEAYEEIIDLLNSNNIPFLLVRAPISSHLYNSASNNDDVNRILGGKQATGVIEFKKLAGNYPALGVLDFNLIMNLDEQYFYDADHLNQLGVETFNWELVKHFPSLSE